MVNLLFYVEQESPSAARGPNPTREAIRSDRKDILSIMKRKILMKN